MEQEEAKVTVEPQQEPKEAPVQEEAAVVEEPVAKEETKKKGILNASVNPDDFDWDAFEKDGSSEIDRKAMEDSYVQTLSKVIENEVVDGVVTAINKREVIVNIPCH